MLCPYLVTTNAIPTTTAHNTMLEFLMYKLEDILPDEDFKDIMSRFSIKTAQDWLDQVRDVIGVASYNEIKEEFKAKREEEQKRNSEMNCFARNKACVNRPTIFQVDIGADKRFNVTGKGVDDLFTALFVGV